MAPTPARLFMLSDSPPDRDLEWSAAGIEGAWRYVNRLYQRIAEPPAALAPKGAPRPNALGPQAAEAERAVHKTIHWVGEDLERFHFNRAGRAHPRARQCAGGGAGGRGGSAWLMRFAGKRWCASSVR